MKDQSSVDFDLSPDGRHIVFTANGAGGTDIYLLDLQTYHVNIVKQTEDYEQDVAFSPDGSRIIFSMTSPGSQRFHIASCSTDGANYKSVTSSPQECDAYPSFSKSGTEIVFARAAASRPYAFGGTKWLNWDVYTMQCATGELRRVTTEGYYEFHSPHFSPDGSRIVYAASKIDASGLESATNLAAVASNGSSPPHLLTNAAPSMAGGPATPDTNTDPVYTPDGKQVVYVSDASRAYDYQLYAMDVAGRKSKRLTQGAHYFGSHVVTPDGKQIMFLSGSSRTGKFNLYKCDIDGRKMRMIADSSLFDDPLHWRHI